MDYEVVHLAQKTVAGLTIRTANSDPNMSADINALWQAFFKEENYGSVSSKVGGNTIGLYSDYENGATGLYDLTVCCEVASTENLPTRFTVKRIPEGRYAKFVLHGNTQAVAGFWVELWQMKLDRKFDCDFEEYLDGCDMENMDIHVYISLN